jgi:hypothetical protein
LKKNNLEILCDITTKVHARIQQDFKEINPMVGVNQKMREMGVPVDAVTIDCLKNGKRIILILHDQQPDMISYQFSFKDKDPDEKFEHIQFNELTENKLYGWIESYLQTSTPSPDNVDL